jgi:pantothenate synthetase
VVDPVTLSVPGVVGAQARLLIAGRIGKARLIDNLAADREGD